MQNALTDVIIHNKIDEINKTVNGEFWNLPENMYSETHLFDWTSTVWSQHTHTYRKTYSSATELCTQLWATGNGKGVSGVFLAGFSGVCIHALILMKKEYLFLVTAHPTVRKQYLTEKSGEPAIVHIKSTIVAAVKKLIICIDLTNIYVAYSNTMNKVWQITFQQTVFLYHSLKTLYLLFWCSIILL